MLPLPVPGTVKFNTIKTVAACARIHWARGTFDRVNPSLLADLEPLDSFLRLLDLPDELSVQLLAVSATAVVLRRIGRWAATSIIVISPRFAQNI